MKRGINALLITLALASTGIAQPASAAIVTPKAQAVQTKAESSVNTQAASQSFARRKNYR